MNANLAAALATMLKVPDAPVSARSSMAFAVMTYPVLAVAIVKFCEGGDPGRVGVDRVGPAENDALLLSDSVTGMLASGTATPSRW